MRPTLSAKELEFLQLAMDSLETLSGGLHRLKVSDPADLWEAPFALLAHDRSTPPRFVYCNARALEAFETKWEDWIGRPSRESAEEDEREARERLLREVESKGFSRGYRGVRISAQDRRFEIREAMLWNVLKGRERVGQAAMFEDWERR